METHHHCRHSWAFSHPAILHVPPTRPILRDAPWTLGAWAGWLVGWLAGWLRWKIKLDINARLSVTRVSGLDMITWENDVFLSGAGRRTSSMIHIRVSRWMELALGQPSPQNMVVRVSYRIESWVRKQGVVSHLYSRLREDLIGSRCLEICFHRCVDDELSIASWRRLSCLRVLEVS